MTTAATATTCWQCGEDVGPTDRFCGNCSSGGVPTRVGYGRYRVEGELGEGTFGVVYRCRDTRLQRTVAIKQLRQSTFSVIEEVRELILPGRLQHPHIVTVHDVLVDEGAIVMEFLEGGSLRDRMDADPDWVRDNFARLVLEMCEALRAAHSERIIHRDIKPENVLLTADGHAKIADFGVCKFLDSVDHTDSLAGSPPYMAFEVLAGEPYGTEADVHSLGCVMFEMAAGARPWDTPGNVLAYVALKGRVDAPELRRVAPDVDDLTNQLVGRMLARGAGRVGTVDTVIQQLAYVGPRAEIRTIDDLQLRLGAIYGYANAQRTPLYLLAQFFIVLRGVADALRAGDEAALARLFPKAFAWLCASASALNVRLGELAWLKYESVCPYCEADRCLCATLEPTRPAERNEALLRKYADRQVNQAPEPLPLAEYRARFARMYGRPNATNGIDSAAQHAFSEVAEAMDALMHLNAGVDRSSLLALHLELSDLLAWLFAFVNLHDGDYDLDHAVTEMFAEGCYACAGVQCVCATPLGVSDWRRALGIEPSYAP